MSLIIAAIGLVTPLSRHHIGALGGAPRVRSLTLLADESKSPFSALFGTLASALEKVLDGAYPGQLQLISEAEAVLRADERATALIGADATLGEIDVKESMSVSAGVQLQCAVTGSRGSGVVTIGGARDDDDGADNNKLIMQLLRLQTGDEDYYVVEP